MPPFVPYIVAAAGVGLAWWALRAQRRSTIAFQEALEARDLQCAALENDLREHRDEVRRARETGFTVQAQLSRRLQDVQGELAEKSRDVDLLKRFATVIDALPDPVVMIALDGEVTYANAAALARAPRVQTCRGFGVLRYLTPESAALVRGEGIPAVLDSGVWQQEVDWRNAEDVPMPLHLTIVAQRDQYHYPEVFVAVGRDVTRERQLRDSLSAREALHRAVIDSLAEGVLVEDREGRVVAWNESALRILGLTDDELLGHIPRHEGWRLSDDADEDVAPESLPVARARQGERVDGELLRVHRTDGGVRDLSMNARPMYADDFDDRPGGVTTFTDVTAQRAAEQQLRFLTERDELTGLLNRRGFMESARHRLAAARANGERCALLYGDLDRFKSINDTFGHAAGDEALREMAAVMSQVFRSADLTARLGGDEFTVFVSGVGASEVERILTRLETALHEANAARSNDPANAWALAASFGAAFFTGGHASLEELLKEADAVQYHTKSRRKAARAA
jgi:diguanylate cyclase (GGDEF)-like protein/PAS domain S-box-containing protein